MTVQICQYVSQEREINQDFCVTGRQEEPNFSHAGGADGKKQSW